MSALQQVKLRKAARVVGKTLSFRNADVADADFILSLRTDSEKSRYLTQFRWCFTAATLQPRPAKA